MRRPASLFLVATVLAVGGCTAPKLAAKLATETSGHVSTLNGELQQYASTANEARQRDAQRIAAAQSRWDQDNAYNQRFLTEWRIDGRSSLTNTFEALQKQSEAEMAITDSYVKRQADAAGLLAGRYDQLSYDPGQLQSVIASLQTLADREGTRKQLDSIKDFASSALSEAKQELKAAQPASNEGSP